jgi:hypothetical protein
MRKGALTREPGTRSRRRGGDDGVPRVEERPRIRERSLDQRRRLAEVDGLDGERARRRHEVQSSPAGESLDVGLEAAMDEQRHRVEDHGERTPRWFVEIARVAGGEDVDLVRPELDGMGDRRVVGDAAVDQVHAAPRHRLEDARDGGARRDRVDRRSLGKADLAPAVEVDRDHVQGDPRVLETLDLEVAAQHPEHAGVGHEVVASPDEADEAGHGVDGKDLGAAHASPHLGELVGRLIGLRAGRDEGPVERAGRGPDDEVGRDAVLVQRAPACRPGWRRGSRRPTARTPWS